VDMAPRVPPMRGVGLLDGVVSRIYLRLARLAIEVCYQASPRRVVVVGLMSASSLILPKVRNCTCLGRDGIWG
jgi:hypothetical protein